MKKKVNFFWILYGLVLAVLFLASSTDLIIKEEEAEVYPISVIVGDTSDENYVNFRKGMERAAMELNGDVSFITLYEKGNARQQEELMLREQEDGSRALIVDPVEEESLTRMKQENLLSVPVICINAEWEMSGMDNEAELTFDYYGMGRRLGEEILREHPAEKLAGENPASEEAPGEENHRSLGEKVYLLEDEESDAASRLFFQGLEEALAPAGCQILPAGTFEKGEPEQALEELTEGWTQKAVLAAADPGSLLATAQFLAETEGAPEWVTGLYGRGNTVPLLNYLDKGIIQGLCVTDDFSAGYLSVKTAVELAKNRTTENVGYLESYYIQREDLRNEKYEKMLYPIE